MPKSVESVLQRARDTLEALWDCTCQYGITCERCTLLADLDLIDSPSRSGEPLGRVMRVPLDANENIS